MRINNSNITEIDLYSLHGKRATINHFKGLFPEGVLYVDKNGVYLLNNTQNGEEPGTLWKKDPITKGYKYSYILVRKESNGKVSMASGNYIFTLIDPIITEMFPIY